MAKQFEEVRNNRPSRSVFNLSYEKKFTADFGKLYPILCDEMVPGDIFKIGAEAIIRTQPLLAPMLHRVDISAHYFFVPYRLLWNDWEEFITGGEDGYRPTSTDTEAVIPVWLGGESAAGTTRIKRLGELWDFLGFPASNVTFTDLTIAPLDFPRRAYNLVWWEYYRDENLQMFPTFVDSVGATVNLETFTNIHSDKARKARFVGYGYGADLSSSEIIGRETADYLRGSTGNQCLLYRNWEKDFFTSALPWQQKGDTPALPISGYLEVFQADASNGTVPARENPALPPTLNPNYRVLSQSNATQPAGRWNLGTVTDAGVWRENLNSPGRLMVDLGQGTSFDVSDLRLAFQIQRWLEQNARAGTRYTEFLRAHFGVSPDDHRLSRPEYVGGMKMPIIISEVLQTSETNVAESPQGNMAGHGISVDSEFVGTYRAEEFGIIIGLMSIMPKPAYQQGINRQWLRRTPLDFYFPEFAHLSERAVERQEIYWENAATAHNVFGFQGIYDEMRTKQSMVHGLFRVGPTSLPGSPRDGFNFWHLGRIFTAPPELNETFIQVNQANDDLTRPFPVPSEPLFFINWGNSIRAIRPMPFMAEPGLIDHV